MTYRSSSETASSSARTAAIMPTLGSGACSSRGVASVAGASPGSYTQEIDCATMRGTPACRAASTRLRVPILRMRPLSAGLPSLSAVSWWMIASGAAAATVRWTASAS